MRRLVVALTLTLIATTLPAVADGPPQPVQVIANILSLSDAQVASWMQLLQARNAAVEPLQRQLQARQQAIAAQLQSGTPDAAAIGALFIEAHEVEQQIASIAGQTNTQFAALLTPEQLTRLQQIRGAAQVCPIVPALEATGLLGAW